ncbi:peroxisomal biogenesis factor 11 [Aspergillus ambiguus]|uniref:PEX11 domain protein n=1 Tax=Aspergillus ambiguus TaxID=176160 RepID=UPI003CCD1859
MTSTSPAKQFSNFTRTSAGLEKTLRLLQAAAQIATEVSVDQASGLRWSQARTQFALTRRFFRFFNFIDCAERVVGLLGGGSSEPIIMVIVELVRWSCLGLYFFLEDLTILHAMNLYPVPWNKPVLVEAYKFWFYALSLSVLSSLWRLAFNATKQPSITKTYEKGKKAAKATAEQASALREQRNALVKRVVVDGCDLLIPGTFVGWIEASDLMVGMAMVVSTLVAGRDIWVRSQ